VIDSDYMSVSLAVADAATGMVAHDGCVSSGSKAPGLTTALSGDVVLPSQPQPGHELLLIDRTNAVLTWLDPASCQVLRQLNVGEGKPANPHDVIPVSAHKAYVTRFAEEASDLAIIDPTAATIIGHVDLRGLSTQPDGDKPALVMPDRGLLVGGKVYVSLGEMSADYQTGGPARLAVVDPATDAVSGTIDLPSLRSCGVVTALPDGSKLAVGCSGIYADPATQIGQSGVGWVDLAASPPAVSVVAAAAFGAPVSAGDVAVLSPNAAFTIAVGDTTSKRPDALWAFDFAGGPPRKVLEGTQPFTLGGLLGDPATGKVFVGDANPTTPRIVVIDASNAAAAPTSVSVNGLPPRSLALY
jgi:hypothetical protein